MPLGKKQTIDLRSIDLMLATSSTPFSRVGWIWEFKFDGWRALANKRQLITRNRNDCASSYPEVAKSLDKLAGDFVIDGEICVVDESGIPQFEQMRLRGNRDPSFQVNYYAFDLLFLNGEDLRGKPLDARKAALRRLIPPHHPHIGYVSHIDTEGEALFHAAVKMGMEGVVGKKIDAPYVGGRSRAWLKVKPSGWHDGWKRRQR